MCTTLEGPIVLELKHLTDMGISAFKLERARYGRDRSFYLRMSTLAEEGEIATPDKLQAIRENLPRYPYKCLKLVLSDGTTELEAVELEPLGLRLGATPMGTKVSFQVRLGG